MHYHVLTLITPPEVLNEETIKTAVAEALEASRDDKWDWWMIGGRWTGAFDGYDPETDPANRITCDLCGGTGNRSIFRHELPQQPGCNGCESTGTRTTWPTYWRFRAGDCKPVAALTEADLDVYAICIEEYGWFGGERYEPWRVDDEKFVKEPTPPLAYLIAEHGDKLAVIVDCHN